MSDSRHTPDKFRFKFFLLKITPIFLEIECVAYFKTCFKQIRRVAVFEKMGFEILTKKYPSLQGRKTAKR